MVSGTAIDTGHPNVERQVAVKIYYPEKSRRSEVDIVAEARKRARGATSITSHLPVLDSMGFDSKSQGRQSRVIIFELQDPITALAGEALVRAWLECIRCR